uniref:Uncharacterized protein n=1 Tax=Anopheles merus TaxID=30066 RepID=A0A182UW07_ANOME
MVSVLLPHQHVQQRVLIFRIARCARLQPDIVGRNLAQLRHRRRSDRPRVRLAYVRARIDPSAAAPPVQLYTFPDRIHQVRRQMVVPHVREPYLRVGQIHRAGEEEPRADRYIARTVRLEEAVNVLPDGGQPFEHLFQLGLLLLVLQLDREELAAQETPQETFHRFHVVRRQDL